MQIGTELLQMSRSTKQDMRSKLSYDYFSQSCSAKDKIDTAQKYMVCIIIKGVRKGIGVKTALELDILRNLY